MAAAVRRRVRVDMRPEDGRVVGRAGDPGIEGAGAGGSVIATESGPCKAIVGEGACWVTVVVS